MRAIQVLLALAATTACTSRNPAFCGDGTCVDPKRPFCDTDGVFGGNPNECIALECTRVLRATDVSFRELTFA
jgi:hypothetical protein